jgi:tyrosyl-tRNA synthetase
VACTDMPMAEIRELESAMARDGMNPIVAKKRLAYEVVALYHGAHAASEARGGFERTVQNKEVPTEMPTFALTPDLSVVDLLVGAGLVPSRGEARRLVEQGGVSLDGEKLTDARCLVTEPGILKAGKRRYLRLVKQ